MKNKTLTKVVTAPQTWFCECGREIKAGEKCVKIGSKKYCSECIGKSLKEVNNEVP